MLHLLKFFGAGYAEFCLCSQSQLDQSPILGPSCLDTGDRLSHGPSCLDTGNKFSRGPSCLMVFVSWSELSRILMHGKLTRQTYILYRERILKLKY